MDENLDFLDKELEDSDLTNDLGTKKNSDMVTSLGLENEAYPEKYIKMVERIKNQYDNLPKMDYNAIYEEIAVLSIKTSSTPTLAVLNDELYRVQAAKDRLSEIFVNVVQTYNFKKRAVDILKDAWGRFTEEKNAESRKGDAAFRLSWYSIDLAETEGLFKACSHVLRNLDSLNDNLSRRITIWQLMTKIQDVGRGALLSEDFDRSGEDMEAELFGEKKEKNSEEENS
jgi:hypothetical protein